MGDYKITDEQGRELAELALDVALRDLENARAQTNVAKCERDFAMIEFKIVELDLQKMRESRDAMEAKLAEVTAQLAKAQADRDHYLKNSQVMNLAVVQANAQRSNTRAELATEKNTTAFLSGECDKLKAENKTLRARFESEVTPDFIEWKAQQEQRMTTDYAKTGIAAHPIVKTLTADAEDAAWCLAGSQFVKLTRDPLSALLSRHLGPEDDALRGKVGEFLKTELGASMLAAFLSLGLSSLPEGNGVAPRLARELRVRAMAGATDVVADVITGPLRQVMATYLQDLPAAPSAPPTLPEGTHAHAPITAAVVGEEVGR